MQPTPLFDVLVAGGSYAGLSAALQAARARRQVLVIDAGVRRNRFAASSHGFLGQDGRAPGEIVDDARRQLLAYPNVRWVADSAESAARDDAGHFVVTTASGSAFHARRLVLATGVVDELPSLPGLAERWGRSVFHCPYCHGYELKAGRIGVLATLGSLAFHQAMLLADWGQVTLFANGVFVPDEAQAAALSARGVAIEHEAVEALVGDPVTLQLRDGRQLPMDGIFTACRTRPASTLAQQLGCAFEEGPLGPFVQADAMRETSVPGVFACGDTARMAGSVALAVGDGAIAGVAAHQSLVFR